MNSSQHHEFRKERTLPFPTETYTCNQFNETEMFTFGYLWLLESRKSVGFTGKINKNRSEKIIYKYLKCADVWTVGVYWAHRR